MLRFLSPMVLHVLIKSLNTAKYLILGIEITYLVPEVRVEVRLFFDFVRFGPILCLIKLQGLVFFVPRRSVEEWSGLHSDTVHRQRCL